MVKKKELLVKKTITIGTPSNLHACFNNKSFTYDFQL